MPADFYQLFRVSRDASEAEIRSEYRRLARKYHPDHCDDDRASERFKTITKAYNVLTDEEERRKYDQEGHDRYVSERLDGHPASEIASLWGEVEDDREWHGSTDDGNDDRPGDDGRSGSVGRGRGRRGRNGDGRDGAGRRDDGRTGGRDRAGDGDRGAGGSPDDVGDWWSSLTGDPTDAGDATDLWEEVETAVDDVQGDDEEGDPGDDWWDAIRKGDDDRSGTTRARRRNDGTGNAGGTAGTTGTTGTRGAGGTADTASTGRTAGTGGAGETSGAGATGSGTGGRGRSGSTAGGSRAGTADESAWRQAVGAFRDRRNERFGTDPASPIPSTEPDGFVQLDYFPPDPTYRVEARLRGDDGGGTTTLALGAEGKREYRDRGTFRFKLNRTRCTLDAFEDDDGTLYVPFRDGTNGDETAEEGRYLAVDPETDRTDDGRWVLDFNYAVNPYSAYADEYGPPMVPLENWLDLRIEAGERTFHQF